MLDLFTRLEDFGNPLQVRVTPKAAANRIKAEHLDNGKIRLRVYVTVAAEDGKANKAVIKLLAKEFSRPASAFTIVRGELIRDKLIAVQE
jgi:hypothetical protein